MRWLWVLGGGLSLGVGVAGMVLPLVPTVPLLLLAAFCFARSSERLHAWLIGHRTFGPPIEAWKRRGAIGRRAKWLASLSILAALGLSLLLGVRSEILVVQALALAAVALFIWTRPD
ncbi:MAG: YbaN family protein [Rhodobacteraceae bacterium]|nr:YbaN family protein [Paracoccaceae bacterium]